MGTFVLVAVVILAAVLVGAGLISWRRRSALRGQFGPEYEREVRARGGRLRAEQELRRRQRLHSELDIRPLSEQRRQRHAGEWSEIQQLFVDDPPRALARADRLVSELLGERGYPTDDRQKQEATLSVEHAHVMDRYREAHEISARNARGEATTEELRRATVDYRSLVEQLLGADPATSRPDQREPR
jgi:hypothetical protein